MTPKTLTADARTLMPDDSHDDALAQLTSGDTLALDAIYQAHSGPVYRYLLALCGDTSIAADAMHDAFVALIDRPDGFDARRGNLGGYLVGIARRVLWARWRDPLHQATSLDDDETPDEAFSDATDDPLQLSVATQDHRALMAALLALPWAFREAVVLVDLQERDYRDAAEIAGIPLNTLRTRVLRGRRRLAHALGARQTKEQSQ